MDKQSHMWEYKQPMPACMESTCGATAVFVDDCIYIVGGAERNCAFYNPAEDAWTMIKSMGASHEY